MNITADRLGATLYVPATRDDLAEVVSGRRCADLRSVVICLEDAVHPQEDGFALARLGALLARTAGGEEGPALFVRPRNPDMLDQILRLAGVEHVAGFVVPKATADTLPAWLSHLTDHPHRLMPTIETREAFDPAEMRRLREQLVAVQDRILALRIGGNDLLQTLGARRSAVRTLYDGPLGPVVAQLVAAFSPWGFAMSAPVFEQLASPDLLREEVERDLEHGLLTKTAVHPAQVAVIHAAYAVSAAELAEARAILSLGSRAVFASRQAMCEPATHRRWAESMLARADAFGIAEQPSIAQIA